jgi:hypothetical protein
MLFAEEKGSQIILNGSLSRISPAFLIDTHQLTNSICV